MRSTLMGDKSMIDNVVSRVSVKEVLRCGWQVLIESDLLRCGELFMLAFFVFWEMTISFEAVFRLAQAGR
jgi:hypothetical protein